MAEDWRLCLNTGASRFLCTCGPCTQHRQRKATAHPFGPAGVVAGMRRYDPALQALCTQLAQDGYEIIEQTDPARDQTTLRLQGTDAHGVRHAAAYRLTTAALTTAHDPEGLVVRALHQCRAMLEAHMPLCGRRTAAETTTALKAHLARLGVDAGI